ncbi:hypothetical protein PGH07_03630 [Sulfurovum sp. zt1-1]|uniref:Uncharacterized protein n=1 Tax=Sulfurovum zhangzhouensis TaxID=3019067 RepID=A0ABT7QWU3_9BACT|nr:hypothetical protein [Sulfurovum zhangzhouensis]MDM5271258.1 hypothetical protein [Sulfurovum zhangzhouensis]
MLKALAFSEVKTEASVRRIERELVQVWAKFVSQIVRFFSRRA